MQENEQEKGGDKVEFKKNLGVKRLNNKCEKQEKEIKEKNEEEERKEKYIICLKYFLSY